MSLPFVRIMDCNTLTICAILYAYIEKPFSPFHLKAQLLNLLKKRESQQKTYASTPLSDLHSAVHNKLDEEFMNKCTEIIQNNIEDSEFSVNTLAQELADAYGFSMGYNYNGKLRSAELLLKEDGSVELIRRAETPEDYFRTLVW